MDPQHIATLLATFAGAAGAVPLTIRAVAYALHLRDNAKAPKLARRLARLEGIISGCQASELRGQRDFFDVLGEALADARAPVFIGAVCEEGRYVRAVGQHWLGHPEMVGLPWDDPRFVHPDDVERSRQVAAAGITAGNRGEVIYMLTARGERMAARVYSTPSIASSETGSSYRSFCVVLGVPTTGRG